MDLIQVIGSLTEYMVQIIILFAVVEILLLSLAKYRCYQHHRKLLDTYRNTVKGMIDIPDSLLSKDTHSQCNALVNFIDKKISTVPEQQTGIKRNIERQLEKNVLSDTYGFQADFRVASTLVQVFPLLGILGTILSLGQLDFSAAEIDSSAITKAFILAIDTTILGLFFAIIFMIAESKLSVTIEHAIKDTEKAFALFTRVFN